MDQQFFISRFLVALPSAEKLCAFLGADRDRIESLMAPAAAKRPVRQKKPSLMAPRSFILPPSSSPPRRRCKVHDLWTLFWSSGLSNPLVANSDHASDADLRQFVACHSHLSPVC